MWCSTTTASADAAAATAAEIEALGRRALPYRADISQAAQVDAMLEEVIARFGRLDVLVNSASVWLRTPWPELSEEAWDRLVDVDLKGAVPVRPGGGAPPGGAWRWGDR